MQDDSKDGGGRVTPGAVAYMDVGKEREHDCMDAGGRATQEAKAEERKLYRGRATPGRLQDVGGRTAPGASSRAVAEERKLHPSE